MPDEVDDPKATVVTPSVAPIIEKAENKGLSHGKAVDIVENTPPPASNSAEDIKAWKEEINMKLDKLIAKLVPDVDPTKDTKKKAWYEKDLW